MDNKLNGLPDALKHNKETAYCGTIGGKRKAFCIDQIEKKKDIFKQFRSNQLEVISKNGETISCHKGCAHCCLAYMQASVQECEAIVYYLYLHEDALATFLRNYLPWREKLRQNGDIFKECGERWLTRNNGTKSEESLQALREAEGRYQRQLLYCPFLHEGSCLIYEVRPFTCAALVATTPGDWCAPTSADRAKTYVSHTPAVFDSSFFYNKITESTLGFMPLAVYGILADGYELLSNIPGLEGLEEAAMEDTGQGTPGEH